MEYDWPGNIRELENAIERAVVLSEGPLINAASVSLLGAGASPAVGLPSLKLHSNIEWAERESVRLALQRTQSVKKEAAALLGISQRALSYYLSKYGLS
jgi:DNA-binding NtrC family response regulator